jgi:hypothetical protein
MIAALAPMLVCGLLFVEQDVRTVRVSMVQQLSGHPVTNFYHEDMDGDGLPDLVFANGVHLQRDGFPESAFLPYPGLAGAGLVDTAGGRVYVLQREKVVRLELADSEWIVASAPIDPESVSPDALRALPAERLRLGRFLHDPDDAGTPDVVVPTPGGLVFFSMAAVDEPFSMHFAGEARILPEMHLSQLARQNLWPEARRSVGLPRQSMACRVLVEENKVTVLERQEEADGIRVTRQSYTFATDDSGQVALQAGPGETSGVLPSYMMPCRLDESGRSGHAGGTWSYPEGLSYPVPVYETGVSTDGNAVFRVRRRLFRPQCILADYNGDGALDLFAESATIHQLGLRETFVRALTRQDIGHAVSVYLQGPDGTFSEPPAFTHTFSLRLDAPLIHGSAFWQRYKAAELVLLHGDCNGDGILDALVHEAPDRAALYLGTGRGYARKPVAMLPVAPEWRLALADVDGDGRSDVVAHWNDWEAARGEEVSRVWLSREATP